MRNIFVWTYLFIVQCNFGLPSNAIHPNCIDCKSTLIVYNEDEKTESVDSIMISNLSVSELERMIPNHQFENDEVFLESITNINNYFFVRELKNSHYLKIYPNISDDFKYDYLTKDDEDIINKSRNMKVKCAYIYYNRKCMANQLSFKKKKNGNIELIFDLKP